MTPEMQQQLEQLKDIHLPQPIAWYPLAVGWWVLIAVGIATVLLIMWLWYHQRHSLRQSVLSELNSLSDGKPIAFVGELSALLRRVAIHCQGQSVQNLSGQAWADFLSSGQSGLPETLANTIASVPYASELPPDVSLSDLRQATEQWIIQAMKGGK